MSRVEHVQGLRSSHAAGPHDSAPTRGAEQRAALGEQLDDLAAVTGQVHGLHGRLWAAEDRAHGAELLLLRVAYQLGLVGRDVPVPDAATVHRLVTAWCDEAQA